MNASRSTDAGVTVSKENGFASRVPFAYVPPLTANVLFCVNLAHRNTRRFDIAPARDQVVDYSSDGARPSKRLAARENGRTTVGSF
jgi:hypothetical protein